MRRLPAFRAFFLFVAVLPASWAAGRETTVFLVRFSGADGPVRFSHQDLPAAARFLFPVPFSIRAGRLELAADSSAGVLERERAVLARRPVGTLESVTVLVNAPAEKNPRPARSVTVAFTLDELLARGGAWAGVPAAWACETAARKSGWAAGRVWVRSIQFDPRRGRFTVKVGLIR